MWKGWQRFLFHGSRILYKCTWPSTLVAYHKEQTLPEYIATKSADIVNKIFKNPLSFENKILNINFPDLLEKDVKGTKFTRLSRRGIPAAPVEISSSHNSKTYRYNLQGEAIKESYLSDVEAVQSGYISLSILDYNLSKADEEKNYLVKILCEWVVQALLLGALEKRW